MQKLPEEILLKIKNNYFLFKDGRFLSYGKADTSYSIGSWFKCKEEEVNRLRTKVLSGDYEIKRKLPSTNRLFG